jgi:hypothetical protein
LHERHLVEPEQPLVDALQVERAIEHGNRENVLVVLLINEAQRRQQLDQVRR